MQAPSWSEMLRVYGKIGLLSFGGPAGQIALMHRELVDERKWIDEQTFLRALNFCHLLPGPEAQQLATYSGWKLGGWRAGLLAGGLFVLPGAAVMLALSILYVMAAGLGWFEALFLGVKAAVLAIVLQALLRIAGRALKGPLSAVIALASFAAFAVFAAPFPLVIAVAGVLGLLVARTRPEWLGLNDRAPEPGAAMQPLRSAVRSSLGAVAIWAVIWAVPLVGVAATLGQAGAFAEIGAFFSKLAVVTFGGAYAVLGYMAQEAVQNYRWLAPGEMADGLGLAETTPGPLIMVTQYVGFLAGYRDPGPFSPVAGGVIGALLTTWVTFAPCFLWIFAFAPWMDRLERARPLQGALAAVTAAVVGVIAQLAAWFALHVLFPGSGGAGSMVLAEPAWTNFDWRAGALAALALVLTFALRRGVVTTLGACASAGLLMSVI
jgi:chromate transporter